MASGLNYSQIDNMSSMDVIINNSRVRATVTNPLGVNYIDGFGTPASMTSGTALTFTSANLLTGIIVANPTAAIAATFPTAALLVAAVNANTAGAVVGDYVTCLVINGNATNALTLTAGSGGTFDANQASGSQAISAGSSKYIFMRLTNVTAGSEAYVIYS